MADELGLTVDEAEFEEAQAASREASRVQKKGGKEAVRLDVHDIAALEKNPGVPKTDDLAKYRKHHPKFRVTTSLICLCCRTR